MTIITRKYRCRQKLGTDWYLNASFYETIVATSINRGLQPAGTLRVSGYPNTMRLQHLVIVQKTNSTKENNGDTMKI